MATATAPRNVGPVAIGPYSVQVGARFDLRFNIQVVSNYLLTVRKIFYIDSMITFRVLPTYNSIKRSKIHTTQLSLALQTEL